MNKIIKGSADDDDDKLNLRTSVYYRWRGVHGKNSWRLMFALEIYQPK